MAVISNSICLGASGSSYWVLPGRTEPFAKGNVNGNFAERIDVTATLIVGKGAIEKTRRGRRLGGAARKKIFHRPHPSLWL